MTNSSTRYAVRFPIWMSPDTFSVGAECGCATFCLSNWPAFGLVWFTFFSGWAHSTLSTLAFNLSAHKNDEMAYWTTSHIIPVAVATAHTFSLCSVWTANMYFILKHYTRRVYEPNRKRKQAPRRFDDTVKIIKTRLDNRALCMKKNLITYESCGVPTTLPLTISTWFRQSNENVDFRTPVPAQRTHD